MEDFFETKEEFIEDNLRNNIPFSKQFGARTYIDIEILPNLFHLIKKKMTIRERSTINSHEL